MNFILSRQLRQSSPCFIFPSQKKQILGNITFLIAVSIGNILMLFPNIAIFLKHGTI